MNEDQKTNDEMVLAFLRRIRDVMNGRVFGVSYDEDKWAEVVDAWHESGVGRLLADD